MDPSRIDLRSETGYELARAVIGYLGVAIREGRLTREEAQALSVESSLGLDGATLLLRIKAGSVTPLVLTVPPGRWRYIKKEGAAPSRPLFGR